jgi:DeoR family fructose operon transcriptional repressor
MYAEERQQAIAQLVADRGRVSVNRARERVRRHDRDGPPRPVRPRARRLVRRVHGGAVPAGALTDASSPRSRARCRQHPEKDRIARAALDLLPPARLHDPDRRRHHHRPARELLPRDHRLVVVTHAVPIAARLAGSPMSSCTCCPAGSARPPRPRSGRHRRGARQLRADIASSAPTASRSRTALHAGPRRGRHQAGAGPRGPPRGRPRRRPRSAREARAFAELDEVDVLSPTRAPTADCAELTAHGLEVVVA